jgi:hypothetical protein
VIQLSRRILQVLQALNILLGALLLLLLGAMLMSPAYFEEAIVRELPAADPDRFLTAARLILALVLPTSVAAYIIFQRLIALLDTVLAGDPFVAVNADRLRTVAIALLIIQIGDVLFGLVGALADTAAGERISAWSPGITGWVAVLLAFVLARVFLEGTRMRDDLEMTV